MRGLFLIFPCLTTVSGFSISQLKQGIKLSSPCSISHDHVSHTAIAMASNDGDEVDEMPDTPSSDSSTSEEDQVRPSDEELLESSIDAFLAGEYDRPFAEDAAAPLPQLSPGETIEQALRSFRKLDEPEPSHGAAVLLRFCLPLTRAERWALAKPNSRHDNQVEVKEEQEMDTWRQDIFRGALTPTMLARRIRSSNDFSGLLDWSKLDVTEGATPSFQRGFAPAASIAFVNAALWFEEGEEPTLLQFTLRQLGGVWLIDTARKSKKGLFMD